MKKKDKNPDDYKKVYEDDHVKITVEFTEKGANHPKLDSVVEMMCCSMLGLIKLYPSDEYFKFVRAQMEIIDQMLTVARNTGGDKNWFGGFHN